MPGNETFGRSSRTFVPWIWKQVNIPSGQSATQMNVSGFPNGISRFAPFRDTSIVSLSVQISTAVTAGWIDFEITKGGAATGQKVRMNIAAGTVKRLDITPGTITGGPGNRIAVECSSDAGLTPSGSIDAVVTLEAQDS